MTEKTQTIPDGWRETTLGEAASIVSGSTPSTKEPSYWDGDIPWITPKDLTGFNNVYILKGERNITQEGLKQSSAQLLSKDTVLFSSRAPIGYIAIAKNDLTTNQGFKNIVCDNKNTNCKYIYYWLKKNTSLIERQSSGSTFSEASASLMRSIKIDLPPITEQKAIADVLSAFDNKIELLREQNKTLEAMSQALFKHWFVDFEFPNKDGKPYKSSGGKMVDSELGEISEGWTVGNVGDYVEIRGGSTPSTKEVMYWNGDINWTTPKDLSTIKNDVFLFDTERKITTEGLQQIGSGLLLENTLLMSSRAPVGYLAISKIPVAINQGYIAFLSGAYFNNYFMYLWLQQNMNIIQSVSGGSTFQEISKSAFKTIKCVVPVESMLANFLDIISPQFEKMAINTIQIRTLAKTRDTLLPKLMRGGVRVKI